jgi:Ser/Thr protein kinase RdoA (MazF antagonist)
MNLPLENIAKIYDLKLTLVEKILGGYLSENYSLTDGSKKYFLKKHRHTDLKQVEEVSLAEQFFADGGVPVILPIKTQQGDVFFEYEKCFYSLYPFAGGHHIERGKLNEQAATSLGATLGVLHKRGKDSSLPISEQFNAWDTEKFLTKATAVEAEIAKENPISEFGKMALESLRLKKEAVLKNTIAYEKLGLSNDHLIHGDYFCDNVFFDESSKVKHVFDFEKTQYAPPMYELFRSMFVSFFSVPNQENLSLAKKYVDAYLSVYPFFKETVRNSLTVAYLKQIHSVWIEEEHYLKHSTRPDDLMPSQLACNQYYLQNRESIDSYLLG